MIEELQSVLYSPDVEAAIQEVFSSEKDPLDVTDFDPIEYINTLFPTEQSLASVDDTLNRMRTRINVLDNEIRTTVREQAESGHDGRQSLEDAQSTIEELFKRISNIKEKAEHSEMMVKKITGDIKQMDIAKKHLTDSIRTLEKLRLLVINLEEIDRNMRMRQYAQVASQLKGADDVVEEFKKYQTIPQIKYLIDRLSSMKHDLAAQIKVDFEKAFSIRGTAGGAKAELHDACLVLDVVNQTAKEELIKWFIKMQLTDYDMLFHESLEPSWLDKVDRRYSWMKRSLLNYEEECAAIFPLDWYMPERICIEFCKMTKKGLSNVMKAKSDQLEVKLLLFAIQKTTAFEKFLAQRFVSSTYIASLVPKKVKPKKETEEEEEQESVNKVTQDSSPFLGMVSRCFEPHLNVYIESQDKNLFDLMASFVTDMKSAGPTKKGEGVVAFPSAADLFIFYKKCLVQCSSLSTGHPLLNLTEIFQKYLKEYATKILEGSLPKVSSSGSGARLTLTGIKRDTPSDSKLTSDDLALICTILCTADYCLETTMQLESKLKEKIDEQFSEKVDFTSECEIFRSLTSTCVQLLVQDLESVCLSAFINMTKLPWGSVEAVGDQSSYVSLVVGHLRQTIPLIRDSLVSVRKYFINFCHKFANVFIPLFITHLYKCKPISTIAAEQLLLDTHSLKSVLIELPTLGAAVTRKAPASYTKLVNTGMEKAELIVKIVMSPHDHAEEFVSHYLSIMHGDNDTNNFHKILEMKGLRKSEQNALLDLFKTKASAKKEGEGVAVGGDKGLLGMRKLEIVERLMRARGSEKLSPTKQ